MLNEGNTLEQMEAAWQIALGQEITVLLLPNPGRISLLELADVPRFQGKVVEIIDLNKPDANGWVPDFTGVARLAIMVENESGKKMGLKVSERGSNWETLEFAEKYGLVSRH